MATPGGVELDDLGATRSACRRKETTLDEAPTYRSVTALGDQSVVVLRIDLQHGRFLGVKTSVGPWERRQHGNCHGAKCGVMHDARLTRSSSAEMDGGWARSGQRGIHKEIDKAVMAGKMLIHRVGMREPVKGRRYLDGLVARGAAGYLEEFQAGIFPCLAKEHISNAAEAVRARTRLNRHAQLAK